VKKYEGLFILNTAGKEEGLKDVIDKITAEVASAGGKVETVQKMDKKNFARISDKRHQSGFYVNIIFNAEPAAVAKMQSHFALNDDVFRVLFTIASEPKAEAATK
jgi:small subunit ribosomal protein S6